MTGAEPAARLDGPTLRELRETVGTTLRQVARYAKLSHGHLSKVERGERGRPITPAVLAAYEKALGVPLAGLPHGGQVPLRVTVRGRQRQVPWRPGLLTDARRRSFNAAIGALAAGGPLGEPPARLLDSVGRPRVPEDIDDAVLGPLRELARAVTLLDLRYGGEVVSQVAMALLRWMVPMVASPFVETDRRLLAVLATCAGRAAWACVDAAGHEAARSLFRFAMHTAVRAGDADLRAHAFAEAAAQHNALGYPEDALELVRLADGDERVGPAVRTVLCGVRARAWARLGEPERCRAQLDAAQDSAGRAAALSVDGWQSLVATPAQVSAQAGHAAAALALQPAAPQWCVSEARAQLADAAGALAAAGRVRAAGLCLARLALVCLSTGALDEAAWAVKEVIDVGATVRSARLRDALTRVRDAAAADLAEPLTCEIVALIGSTRPAPPV